MTAEATPINSGLESANSCTAPPPAPKKKREKSSELLKARTEEMKKVKRDLTEELKTVKKTLSAELRESKKSHEDEIREMKKAMTDGAKKASATIAQLKSENVKLARSVAMYEKKMASLLEKNTRLLEVKNAHTRPTRLPKKDS
jgi:gas vesicle protein